jgi:hypothetical protein
MKATYGDGRHKPCNKVEVEFEKIEDPEVLAKQIARICYKEAALMDFDPPATDSMWGKVARGMLNPMSQEWRVFEINLKDHIQDEWITKMGKKPTKEIPTMVDEDKIQFAKF